MSSRNPPRTKSIVVKVRNRPTQEPISRRGPPSRRDREHNRRNYWRRVGPSTSHPGDRFSRSPRLPHSQSRRPYDHSLKTKAREYYVRRQQEKGAKFHAHPQRGKEGNIRGSPPKQILPPKAAKSHHEDPPIRALLPEVVTGLPDTNQALRVIVEAVITASLRGTTTPVESSPSWGVSRKASS